LRGSRRHDGAEDGERAMDDIGRPVMDGICTSISVAALPSPNGSVAGLRQLKSRK
jgi:hypothetical protein